MEQHPIADLFKISLDCIKEMIDVNTICGDAIAVSDEISVIPVSKVNCVFATGGCEQNNVKAGGERYPFGGATGGTLTLKPIGFLVCSKDEVRLLHLDEQAHLYEKLIDELPGIALDLKNLFSKPPQVSSLEV
ncbi:MAG TPA: sporulation protein YtfJ, partial [Acholeplasmataceae bacterium]|nr:sporulation protein YtfJ [Acholeplasmataceae bacterium]